MFVLTEDFLDGLGLDSQPQAVRQQLLEASQQLVQQRVLGALADQITDDMADELDGINSVPGFAARWLASNLPSYRTSPEFALIKEGFTSEDDATIAYAQAKWFERNLPTFPQEVVRATEQVKRELASLGKDGL